MLCHKASITKLDQLKQSVVKMSSQEVVCKVRHVPKWGDCRGGGREE